MLSERASGVLTDVTDPNLRGTIKELAQLDGAFVVSRGGVVLSACRYLDAVTSDVEVPLGLGSRHIAAANMSAVTDAVSIVVSESSVVRLFCHGKLVGEIIPEQWMINRTVQLRGSMKKETFGELTVAHSKCPADQHGAVTQIGGKFVDFKIA